MIRQEQEISEAGTEEGWGFKQLRLISPERAQRLGFPAESPVFVSPIIYKGGQCDSCGQKYTPLIYPADSVVEAQHFHQEDGQGGIYYYHHSAVDASFGYNGWIAEVKPIGPVVNEGLQLRAPKVQIVKIRAFCRGRNNDGRTPSYCRRELQKGFVFLEPLGFPEKDRLLLPFCGLQTHPGFPHPIRFRFQITPDGIVLFAKP